MAIPLAATSCFGGSKVDSWSMIKDENGEYVIAKFRHNDEGSDKEISLKASDFYKFVEGTSAHITGVYDELAFDLTKKIYIEDVFASEGAAVGQAKYDERVEDAKARLQTEKDTFKANNGKGWEAAWNKYVTETKGFENEKEYMEKDFILPTLQSNVNNYMSDFVDENKSDVNKDPNYIWGSQQDELFNQYFKDRKPLGVRHVLLPFEFKFENKNPIEAGQSGYTTEQYENLKEAFTYLSNESGNNGINWKDFARDYSSDGSKGSSGFFKFTDLSNLDSVDEFRYATYDLAARIEGNTTGNATFNIAAAAANAANSTILSGTGLSRTPKFAQVDGEEIAIVMSQFGVHFIGLEGIGKHAPTDDTATADINESLFYNYTKDRTVKELNHPNTTTFQWHSQVKSNLSSYYTSFRTQKLLDFAAAKNYITWTSTDFKNKVYNYYNNVESAMNTILVEEYLTLRNRWLEKVAKDTDASLVSTMLSTADLKAYFNNNTTIWTRRDA